MTETFESRDQARLALLRQAVSLRPQSADLVFQLAGELAGIGRYDEYASHFRKALLLDPNIDPWPVLLPGETQQAAALRQRERMRALVERGVVYAPVLAALVIAEALLGNDAEVARLVDFEGFLRCAPIAPPAGYTAPGFHAVLAEEIESAAQVRKDPAGSPLHHASRLNGLMQSPKPVFRALAEEIRGHVERYIAQLPAGSDHPFVAARPEHYDLRGWAIVSNGESRLDSHFHPRAWLAGVYYVVQPEIADSPGSDGGWLRVGPPTRGGVTVADGFPERRVKPEPGHLLLMPGYFFHELPPMGVAQKRISVAFNVMPREFGAGDAADDGG
ncbi:MAG TPA: putative 2OG-Fe(II) oxygenase [Rhizomicrobium sp.]